MTNPQAAASVAWPTWLNMMPVAEVMHLAAGGSGLAKDYIAFCRTLSLYADQPDEAFVERDPATSVASEVEFLRGYENGYAAAYSDAIRYLRRAGSYAQAEVVREELWHPLMRARSEYVAAFNAQGASDA